MSEDWVPLLSRSRYFTKLLALDEIPDVSDSVAIRRPAGDGSTSDADAVRRLLSRQSVLIQRITLATEPVREDDVTRKLA